MHRYRTHDCGQLRAEHVGQTARLSGWVHRKRDHGNLLFLDLRDHYGLTQCVTDVDGPAFAAVDTVQPESVVTVTGRVAGDVLVAVQKLNVDGRVGGSVRALAEFIDLKGTVSRNVTVVGENTPA